MKIIFWLLVLTSLLLIRTTQLWSAEEHKTAGTVSGATWTAASVANLNTANDVRATHANADGVDSIYMTNFGFTIPAGATIDSVFVSTQHQGSASQAARRRIHVHLTTDAATVVGEEPGNISSTQNVDTDNETIGPTTPTWNYTLTADSINLTNFGTIVHNAVTQTGTIEVDSVSIRVVYTEAAGGAQTNRRQQLLQQRQRR